MRAVLRRLVCRLSGGHELSAPLWVEGHWCRRCLYDCGYRTRGVHVGPKWERPKPTVMKTVRTRATTTTATIVAMRRRGR